MGSKGFKKKLLLDREHIRGLTQRQLGRVVGGWTTDRETDSCACSTSPAPTNSCICGGSTEGNSYGQCSHTCQAVCAPTATQDGPL